MTARLIRKSWWVDFRFDHTRLRKRSPENSRAGARAYETALRHRLAQGEDITRRKGLAEQQNFAAFVPKWFEEYVVPNNKPGEQRVKKYTFSASLVPFFGRMAIPEIGVRDVEHYKAKLIREGKSHKTINNHLTMLRKCLHTAFDWKGNRERHVPLDIDLHETLSARRKSEGYVFLDGNGQPFTHKKVSAALAEVCHRAGLRKIGWHTLRHTFATHLSMNGTPLNIVQALLGHSSITTTMRYAHVAPSALRTAIELANPRTARVASIGQPVGNRWQERQLQNGPQ